MAAATGDAMRSSRLISTDVVRSRLIAMTVISPRSGSSAATTSARASLECVHDLHFKAPAFMGPEDRRKVVDTKRSPVDDEDHATFTVGRDSAAEPVVEHPIRTR